MKRLQVILTVSLVLIFLITFKAIVTGGYNWPVVFFGDLLQLDWRAQFNIDFSLHMILFSIWICWRERFTGKGYLLSFLCIFLGGLFTFPYLLFVIHKARGEPQAILIGRQAEL
jgi:hypothetical protein